MLYEYLLTRSISLKSLQRQMHGFKSELTVYISHSKNIPTTLYSQNTIQRHLLILNLYIHSFTQQKTDLGGVKMTARTPNNVKRKKTEFAATDENSLSCALKAVGIATAKSTARPSCLVGVLYDIYRETNNRSTANQPLVRNRP